MKAKPQGERPARRLLYKLGSRHGPSTDSHPEAAQSESGGLLEGLLMAGPFKWYIRLVSQIDLRVKTSKFHCFFVILTTNKSTSYFCWMFLGVPDFEASYLPISRSCSTLVNTYTRYTPGK